MIVISEFLRFLRPSSSPFLHLWALLTGYEIEMQLLICKKLLFKQSNLNKFQLQIAIYGGSAQELAVQITC